MSNIVPIERYLAFVSETEENGMAKFQEEILESGIDPRTPAIVAILQFCIGEYTKILSEEEWQDDNDAKPVINALLRCLEEALRPIGDFDTKMLDISNNEGLEGLLEYINTHTN